jgi:hypothetical protein
MTDPMDALKSLQVAVDNGRVALSPCEIYPDLRVVSDQRPEGPALRTQIWTEERCYRFLCLL